MPTTFEAATSIVSAVRGVRARFTLGTLHERTAPFWVRSLRVQVIHDGGADEICEAWDSEDRLVMQSTQITELRIPPDATLLSDAR